MKKINDVEPIVTDHAVIRYLERVKGVDIAAARREIAAKTAQAVRLGATSLVSEGYRYVLADAHVTTVSPRKSEALPRMRAEADEA